jgi:hypothetical protein
MNCKYYEKSVRDGHCPFDVVCDEYCYFTHKLENNDISRTELENELDEAHTRIATLESLLQEAYEELGQDCPYV